MKVIDLRLEKILKNRKTGWVAVSTDFRKVLTSGRKLNEVTKKVKKEEDIYYLPVTKNLRGFIGKTQ